MSFPRLAAARARRKAQEWCKTGLAAGLGVEKWRSGCKFALRSELRSQCQVHLGVGNCSYLELYGVCCRCTKGGS
jgi:hypothetical protein